LGIRSAFDQVGDEHAVPTQAHRRNDFGQEFTRHPDKRFPTLVFFGPRSLSDKKDLGVDISDSKNDRLSRRRQVRTLRAGENLRP
jgi:hypothetical protein